MSHVINVFWNFMIEYETPRLVKIHNHKLGLVRRLIQSAIIFYILFYALWLQKGYQDFSRVESSVTTKIKGVTKSVLSSDSNENPELYTRVWDVADYVVPPAENGAFFVATNVIITPNQTRGTCPEDHTDVKNVECEPISCNITNGIKRCLSKGNACLKGKLVFKSHGPFTGYCIPSDRPGNQNKYVCEVESWCPIEIDQLPLRKSGALMKEAGNYTVFVKNSIGFPYFGNEYVRNNLISNDGRPCLYHLNNPDDGCQIFRLGDMVAMAGGDFSRMAIKGGVVLLSIVWNCNLDFNFMKYCLPKYSFRILDRMGWNFRHGKYHEENRRTLYKMYGIKFLLQVEGRGGKFNIKNTILNLASGLALLGIATFVCDFLLMYIKEKGAVKMKKYDYVDRELRKNATTSTRSTMTSLESKNFLNVSKNVELSSSEFLKRDEYNNSNSSSIVLSAANPLCISNSVPVGA